MKLRLPVLLAGCLFAASTAQASGYKQSIDGQCSVWAPSTLEQTDYAARYAGDCRNGRAEGHGRLEWLYVYSEMKIKAIWEGTFRNGVFLGDQKVTGKVEALSGDRYLFGMDTLRNAALTIVATSAQDGPPNLCRPDRLILVPVQAEVVGDASALNTIYDDAVRTYRDLCPNARGMLTLEVLQSVVTPHANGRLQDSIASARYDLSTDKIDRLRNKVIELAQENQRQNDFKKTQQEAQLRLDAFSKQHSITAWVTPEQLSENPFRWEDKVVGLVVKLDRMLTRTTALAAAVHGWSRSLLLTEITPEFPGNNQSVLLAARVKGRSMVENSGNKTEHVSLQVVTSYACERADCDEWFVWMRGSKDKLWGEAYPRKR